MRILLVSPASSFPDVPSRWLRIPQLSLPVLASLTPPGHEVVTVEEDYEPVPFEEQWDVVGISAMTAVAQRGYEMADHFRKRGAKIVIGGIHASVMPYEAARHADAVVVGEAEGIWDKVLHDAEHDQLQQYYNNVQPDISKSPLPRREKRRRLRGLMPDIVPIMASRGCPHDCEFCCVHRVYGRKQRHISVEQVIRDIRQNHMRHVVFLDDNIGGNRSYAMELFKALRPLRIRWTGQASVRFMLDDELFKAALASGLEGLFVGIESIEPAARKKMRKSLSSIKPYEEAIRRCREGGVIFHGSLIFGLDEQTPKVFEHTLEFLMRNNVPSITPNILTPYPGTGLFDRLRKAGRILHTNWRFYDHHTVCYQPLDMSPEELSEKYVAFGANFFSWASIMRRSAAQLRVSPLVYLGMNRILHKSIKLERKYNRRYFKWLRQRNTEPTFEGIPLFAHPILQNA